MLPSPRLILLVALLAPGLVLGELIPAVKAVSILYAMTLAAYTALDALMLPRRRRMIVERHMDERLSLNGRNRVSFTCTNRTRRTLTFRIADHVPPRMTTSAAACGGPVAPGETVTFSYDVIPLRRGAYTFDEADVRVQTAGSILLKQFRVSLPRTIQVFPNLANIRAFELMMHRGMLLEQGLARQRYAGLGYEFESLRPYRRGDSMAGVDWKSTAKYSKLMVKNYQPERRQSLLAVLDTGRATAAELGGVSKLDYYVNAVFMLAYVTLRQGDWFSLLAFSDEIKCYVPPLRGVQSLEQVGRSLYALDSDICESDYSSAFAYLNLKNRRRSLICFMTDIIDRRANDDVIAYLSYYARRHLPLAVLLKDPDVTGAAEQPLSTDPDPFVRAAALDVLRAREDALSLMRARGVQILDVLPDRLTHDLINRYLHIKARRRL